MKCSKFVAILLLGVVSLGPATIVHSAEKPKSVAAPSARSPRDVAMEALARWKTTLAITDDQAPRFESVMIDSYRRMAQAKAGAAGDKQKLHDSVMAVFTEREQALTKVLTPEQMKLYHQHVHHAASVVKAYADNSASR